MQIAVVGAGLAGLAVLVHLLRYPQIQATLFDPKGVGGGASGVSTGLLHPFPARDCLRSWRAEEGMEAAGELLREAEAALGSPVCERSGLFRLAVTDQQREDFQFRAQNDPDAIWVEKTGIAGAAPVPGLWIPKGTTVYSQLYLQGLWRAAESKGAKWEAAAVDSLQALENFDAVVLATGAETLRFSECRDLPLKITKGQTLICRWPEGRKIPCSLLSHGHLTPTADSSICQIGSTYERHFSSAAPDPATALPLLEKAALFYPPAREFEVVEIRSGVRISPNIGYRPIVAKIGPKAWIFTGLGSRGMLYHALLGKALAKEIVNQV